MVRVDLRGNALQMSREAAVKKPGIAAEPPAFCKLDAFEGLISHENAYSTHFNIDGCRCFFFFQLFNLKLR